MSKSASGSNSRSISVPPKYCRKKCRGRADRAFVKIDGKQVMLGVYGSDESREKYAELVGLSPKRQVNDDAPMTVAVVMVAFLEHARLEYRHEDGSPTTEYDGIRVALSYLRRSASHVLAEKFGPKKLK